MNILYSCIYIYIFFIYFYIFFFPKPTSIFSTSYTVITCVSYWLPERLDLLSGLL